MIKSIHVKLDSDLIKQIQIKAKEKNITQNELITRYLLNGLKQTENISQSNICELENKLNIKTKNHFEDIDFEIPPMLKYNPSKVTKPVSEKLVILENDNPEGDDIFTDIMGIVRSPKPTNSVELKKELYDIDNDRT